MRSGFLSYMPAALAPAALVLGGGAATADDVARVIVIRDHRFVPAILEVPAEARVELVIDNQDGTAEELESPALRREKVVPANAKATIRVGPLPKGEHEFFGEFHQDTAQGRLIAK